VSLLEQLEQVDTHARVVHAQTVQHLQVIVKTVTTKFLLVKLRKDLPERLISAAYTVIYKYDSFNKRGVQLLETGTVCNKEGL
jgi:hypothetical protein